MCGMLGMKLVMEESAVEEFFLDGDHVRFSFSPACSEIRPLFVIPQLEKMDAFFAPSGPKCLLFYYEEHRTNNPDGKRTFRPST